MQCLALQHVAFEDLGLFAPALERRGYRIDHRQADGAPVTVEEWRSADLVVVLGGPIAAYDLDNYPWLASEIEGLRDRLALKRPTLGLCLGAQLMAAALGAPVYAGQAKEIGWGWLALTPEGSESILAPLEGRPVLHWHGDTFDLPAGAVRLASTPATPNQAFAVGTHALGLQFHCEADPSKIEAWLVGHHAELAQAGVDIPALRAQSLALRGQAAGPAEDVLGRWLAQLA